MDKNVFRALEANAQLRYLADIRGVPKGTVGVVEETAWRDDGNGSKRELLCRIRLLTLPEGKSQYPFMKHLLAVFESEAGLFERVDPS